MKTAAQDGVRKLHHYQGKNLGFLKDVLTDGRLRFSNPKNFNDPWDCNPYFDVDVEDPADRRKWGERLDRIYHDLPFKLRQQLEAQWKGNWYDNKPLLQQSINKLTATVRELTVERWRIYCLTPHPNSLLLWAHYAEKHQGICLEFDAGIEQIAQAQRVVYNDTLPIIGPDEFAYPKALVDAVLLTKSHEWAYEDEYRVLARDHDIDPAFSTKTQKDYLQLAPGALTGVIAGCSADIVAIKDVLSQCGSTVPLKRAVRVPNQYRLQIVDYVQAGG